MKRKKFLQRIGTAVFVLPIMNIIGCSEAEEPMIINPDMTGDCPTNGAKNGTISQNHGHTLNVPKSDIEAGIEKTYNIQGSSQHFHNITLTADNFSTLKNNQKVILDSSNVENHVHTVTVVCA